MSQILKLTHENQQLKRQINQYQQVLGVSPYVDDSLFKGGYRVVKTIADRDAIKCCWRKQGMKVVVIGEDLSFKEYVLKTDNCKENAWEEVDITVEENEVFLTEDYSELSENLTTQKELNLVLKQLILNLQTNLNDKLDKGTYTGTAQDLKNDIDSKANILHTHEISDINNLQGSLEDKLNKPTSDGTYVVKKIGSTISYEIFSSIDLSNYYTKTETYSQTEINSFLSGKQNTIGYTPENSANKSDSYTVSSSSTYASTKALVDGLATKANTSHTHSTSDITNLQTSLDTKQKKLSSFDESILIETDGNIEGNTSLFTEYFNQQECELNFIPTQIIGVYKNGVKLLPEEFNITLPKTITIITYSTEKIEIQYTHLKNN